MGSLQEAGRDQLVMLMVDMGGVEGNFQERTDVTINETVEAPYDIFTIPENVETDNNRHSTER